MTVKTWYSGAYEIRMDTTQVDAVLDALAVGLSVGALELFLRGEVSEFFEQDIQSRFDSEGDSKSGAWAELADATLEMREYYGFEPAHPINKRTGDLEEFVTKNREQLSGAGWVEMQVPGTPTNPVIATKLKTAQQGNNRNPIPNFGPTPARPVLAVDETDLMKIMEMLVVHIESSLVGLGSGGSFI